MFRHYLIAALRNMAANRLQSAIAIFGLAVGIATAVLAAAIVRNQTTYEHFIPGYERVYVHVHVDAYNGSEWYFDDLLSFASALKMQSPEIESLTQICEGRERFQHGSVAADEWFFWATPTIFDVLPLPVFRGDPKAALSRPDGLVLTRSAARKYFGSENVVGRTLSIGGQPKIIGAVIQDLPTHGTALKVGFYGKTSGLHDTAGENGSYADVGAFASGCVRQPQDAALRYIRLSSPFTYIRLKPGTNIASIEARERALDHSLSPKTDLDRFRYYWLPIDRINLHPGFYPGMRDRLIFVGCAGLLILALVEINFLNLTAARMAQRAMEVGVRKLCGAGRTDLILQFIGETVLTAVGAGILGLAMAECLLPVANAFLGTGASLDYARDPVLMPGLIGGIIFVGVLGGAYPALVLSSFPPVLALKGLKAAIGRAVWLRNGLVLAQFAGLILLGIALGTILVQRNFALKEATHANTAHTMIVQAPCSGFRDAVLTLPQVEADECTNSHFLVPNSTKTNIAWRGHQVGATVARTEPGVFDLYGIRPMAGQVPKTGAQSALVINESARRAFGFASDGAALGKIISLPAGDSGAATSLPVAAVVPDFSFASVELPVPAILYAPMPQEKGTYDYSGPYNNIRLRAGYDVASVAAVVTLAERFSVKQSEQNWPGQYLFFLDDYIRDNYQQMTQQQTMITAFSVTGLLLACLGLYALSLSVASRRIKEIGIRKSMGARNVEIITLLLWQFAKPVLWANLIAWPLAFWAMNRWLSGFAYHVAMPLWLFPTVGAANLLIAMLTVSGQALLVARQKPVLALRYE